MTCQFSDTASRARCGSALQSHRCSHTDDSLQGLETTINSAVDTVDPSNDNFFGSLAVHARREGKPHPDCGKSAFRCVVQHFTSHGRDSHFEGTRCCSRCCDVYVVGQLHGFCTFMPFIASALTSGITKGTPSVMRKAEELSTTVHPASDAIGANFWVTEPPAENNAISQSPKLSSVSSSQV